MTLEICAELSCNHLGSFGRAMAIAEAAAEAGADLFKVQVWEPGTMCFDPEYTLSTGPWKGRMLVDLYREAWTPWDWLPKLFERVRRLDMEPFGAAFDFASVDYLETLGVNRHKVASFELTDVPLIRHMASKGKPMIISTGMATETDVSEACFAATDAPLLLKCTSAYPAPAKEANLRSGQQLFVGPWGLSDHTHGVGVACAAVALGACYVEKHLTLSRSDGGLDAGFSMEPAEFRQLVTECRRAADALGEACYGPSPSESTDLRRSLWVCADARAGDPVIFGANVRTARPARGMSPAVDVSGRWFASDVRAGTPLTEELLR